MADLLKYRYVGERDAAGVPLLSLSHPFYGGIPARDLRESDMAQIEAFDARMADEESYLPVASYLEISPLYERVTVAAARSDTSGDPVEADPNVPSPGMPEEQRGQVVPPGASAFPPSGEVPSGPPTDAQAQMAAERAAAAANPAIQENPPVVRRGKRGE